MKRLQKEVISEFSSLQSLPVFTHEQVAQHNKREDAWIVIDGIVYDVSKFGKFHPGGAALLWRYSGTDVSKDFYQVHDPTILKKPQYQKLQIGRLNLSEAETGKLLKSKVMEKWLPYCDPYWNDVRGTFKSPHVTAKHIDFHKHLRDYIKANLAPKATMWDESGTFPMKEVAQELYKAGFYSPLWPKEYGGTPPEGWDAFMDFLFHYEIVRSNSGGVTASLWGSIGIGLPPVLHHGTEELKQRVAVPCIKAEKFIALLITEPWAGSDVAGLRCFAVDKGDHYLVSGEKKFITGGMSADYFTTAVRTDANSKGMKGISLLVIDANAEGVERKRMKTQGWWGSTTAYITFDQVKVPKANLIGEEGKGFLYVMENFNHERFTMIAGMCSGCQGIIGLCVNFARKRHTFGKPLIEHQVIRKKIADMVMRTEALFCLAEQVTLFLKLKAPPQDIAPRITLCKAMATQTLEFVMREASQVFGGYSYQRGGGPGHQIERVYRDVRVNAIAGGSEEIMMDFAMRASKY